MARFASVSPVLSVMFWVMTTGPDTVGVTESVRPVLSVVDPTIVTAWFVSVRPVPSVSETFVIAPSDVETESVRPVPSVVEPRCSLPAQRQSAPGVSDDYLEVRLREQEGRDTSALRYRWEMETFVSLAAEHAVVALSAAPADPSSAHAMPVPRRMPSSPHGTIRSHPTPPGT